PIGAVLFEVTPVPAPEESVLIGVLVIYAIAKGVVVELPGHSGRHVVVEGFPAERWRIVGRGIDRVIETDTGVEPTAPRNDVSRKRGSHDVAWAIRIGRCGEWVVDLIANRVDSKKIREIAVAVQHRGHGAIDVRCRLGEAF